MENNTDNLDDLGDLGVLSDIDDMDLEANSDLVEFRPLEVIEAEINFYKEQTMAGMVEIGKRLKEAKEQVGHGQWANWLEEKVNFSQETARKMMKIADEFSNSTALWNLTATKAYKLLEVSSDDRKDFTENNNLEEMTTRQIDEAVKEYKQKIEAMKNAEKDAQILIDELLVEKVNLQTSNVDKERELKMSQERVTALQKSVEEEKEKTQKEVDRLKGLIEAYKNVEVEPNEEPSDEAKEQIDILQGKLYEAEEKVEQLTAEINNPKTIEPAVIEKVPEDIEKELEELRSFKITQEQISSKPNPVESTSKYKVYFNGLVEGFGKLLQSLAEISEDDAETGEKYKRATIGMIEKFKQELNAE